MYKVQFNRLFGLDINKILVRYFLFEKKERKPYYLIKLIEPFKIHPNFYECQIFFFTNRTIFSLAVV